jgi:predicted house-cleaning NTP pyrophosphatase (Maf/HAM1 superfamily)
MRKIILATASPHRIEAFRSLGLDIIVEPSNIGERTEHRPDTPEGLVKYLARLKAEHIANKPLIEKNHSDGIVMGFDSVGYFNSTI